MPSHKIHFVRNSLTRKLLEVSKGTVSGAFAKRRLISLIQQSNLKEDAKVEDFCLRASSFIEKELLDDAKSIQSSSQDANLEKISHIVSALSIQMNRKDLLEDLDNLSEVTEALRSELIQEKPSKKFMWKAFGHAFSVLQGGTFFKKDSIRSLYRKDKYELLSLLEESLLS